MTTRLPLLVLSFSISLPAGADTYFEMDTFFSSEPIALDAISNKWQSDYHPNGEKQTASVWLESGLKKNGWSLGLLYREEHHLTFSSNTADLYYTISNDQELTPNQDYKIDLDAYRFRGIGARAAKNVYQNNALQLSLGGSFFYATNLLEGTVTGSASADNEETYSYEFAGDYVYDEDPVFDRPNVDSPTGVGLALDVGMLWQANSQTQVALKVKDLAGAIHWSDAPYTEAQASSDTNTINDDGLSSVNPILTGVEGYRSSYTQNLKTSANLSVNYQLKNSPYSANTKLKYINDLTLYAVGGSKQTQTGKLSFHYWPQLHTLEGGFQGKKLGLSLAIDNLDFSETQTVWLNLKYH